MESLTGVFFHSSVSVNNNTLCRVFTKEKGCVFVSLKKRKKGSRGLVYSPLICCSFFATKRGSFFFLKNGRLLFDPSLGSVVEKKALLLVLGEVLSQVIRPGYKNSRAFGFITLSLSFFARNSSENFFLFFLVGLFRALGYSVWANLSSFSHSFSKKKEALFSVVLNTPFEKQNEIVLDKKDRDLFVGLIFDCYLSCFSGFAPPKSYLILEGLYEK